jgi:predicted nucleic acid-binding Zn finger protein
VLVKKPSTNGYKAPPDKTKIDEISLMYGDYQNQLSEVFGDDWKVRREIDQALWVYGHQKL